MDFPRSRRFRLAVAWSPFVGCVLVAVAYAAISQLHADTAILLMKDSLRAAFMDPPPGRWSDEDLAHFQESHSVTGAGRMAASNWKRKCRRGSRKARWSGGVRWGLEMLELTGPRLAEGRRIRLSELRGESGDESPQSKAHAFAAK